MSMKTPVPEAKFGMGLDLSRPDEISEDEKESFKKIFAAITGRQHLGLNFWLDTRPDILKRYRIWADKINTRGDLRAYNPNGYGFVYLYGITGYTAGAKYIVTAEQSLGLSREQVLEGIATAFLWLGPRGMETVAVGLSDYEWKNPEFQPRMPANWAPDPKGFTSGLDFETPDLSDAELLRLKEWYLRVEGEIPRYVEFLDANGRRLLKAYRHRFETALTVLPKQVMPYVMIDVNVMRGHREGIREGVLLARGFGMTKEQVAEAIAWGMFYGGVSAGSIVDEAAGDVLGAWA